MAEVKNVEMGANAQATEQKKSSEQLNFVKAVFLGARLSGSEKDKERKIGITILIPDSIDENGQIHVSSDSRVINKQQVTIWPIVQKWEAYNKEVHDKYLYKYSGGRDFYCAVSGKGGFVKLHGEISKEDFDAIQRLAKKYVS